MRSRLMPLAWKIQVFTFLAIIPVVAAFIINYTMPKSELRGKAVKFAHDVAMRKMSPGNVTSGEDSAVFQQWLEMVRPWLMKLPGRSRLVATNGIVLLDTAGEQEGKPITVAEVVYWWAAAPFDLSVEPRVRDGVPFYLVSSFPEDIHQLGVLKYAPLAVTVLNSVGVIMFLLLCFLELRMTRAMQRLVQTMSHLGDGNLQARTGMGRRRDELGDLARGMDKMAEALLDARQKMEKGQQARRTAVAAIAHDLRAPLSAMLLHAQAIQQGAAGEPSQSVGAILESGTLLNQYIQELLELTTLEAAQAPEDLHLTDLTELVRQALVSNFPTLEQAGMEVYVDIPEEPIWVLLATGKLERVLNNLVDNARKYAPDGGYLAVMVWQKETWARVEFTDRGAGIPDEDRERIFEWFYRPKGHSSSANGTGLGLAIAREILHRMGGQIGLECPPNGGSRFWIELPVSTDRQM